MISVLLRFPVRAFPPSLLTALYFAPPSQKFAPNLPLDWLLDPTKPGSPSDRILAYLVLCEARSSDVSLRDDLRIAQLIVIHADRGDAKGCSVAELAWYEILGKHPSKVWPAILARRKALLGQEWAPEAGEVPPQNPIADLPGPKPSNSTDPEKEEAA